MKNKLTSLYLISIFKNILEDSIIKQFINFLNYLNEGKELDKILESYSQFIYLLYNKEESQNLYKHLKHIISIDENILSNGCSDCIKKNEQILETARYELKLFDELISFYYEKIKEILIEKFPNKKELIEHLPVFSTTNKENFNLEKIMENYNKLGYGNFACYTAFKFTQQKEILPIKYFDTLTFEDLKNYEYQKNIIKANTLAFLQGKQANNVLLYGDRGCGKSSTVKALVNEFNDYNLKIIQVYKESFMFLSELFDKIRNLPLKFIIFADDISFDENDPNFSSIKAVLEGSLENKPNNTLIYATTNRMHLVKESFQSREGNEVHYNDTIDEVVSLSDRFGIMLTFSLLTKTEYLDIVKQIANDCCVDISEELLKKAEFFSAQKGIRTPRIARQFITDYLANIQIE